MTFYLDADIPLAVRRAIAECRDDVLYAGGPEAPSVDAKDHEWLPRAGQHGWVVISRDKKIRRKPVEIRAVIEHGVKLFVLTSAGNLTRWETLGLILRRWDDIASTAGAHGAPLICSVTRSDVRFIHPRK